MNQDSLIDTLENENTLHACDVLESTAGHQVIQAIRMVLQVRLPFRCISKLDVMCSNITLL
jgi:hypothetical protein